MSTSRGNRRLLDYGDHVGGPDHTAGHSLNLSDKLNGRTAPPADVAVQRVDRDIEGARQLGKADGGIVRDVFSQGHAGTFAPCEVSRQAKFRTGGLTQNRAVRDNLRMNGPSYDLHKHIKAWRKHLGLTQEQVANKTGSGLSTISGWENGDRTMDLDDLKVLADAYGVAPALLLYAPPGSPKLKALDELSTVIDGMEPEAMADLIRMAKRLAAPPAK